MNAVAGASNLRIIVNGALGRMGQEVVAAVAEAPDMTLVCGVDVRADHNETPTAVNPTGAPVQSDLGSAIEKYAPDVIVDFSVAQAASIAAQQAINSGVAVVIGTTGLEEVDLQAIRDTAEKNKIGAIVAPNFAIGAVLLIHLANMVSRYFEYADIIESHHERKIDAPSGTAQAIAASLVKGREAPFLRTTPDKQILTGSMGANYEGIGIHALRMQGRLAHHEIVLGTAGQTLSLRHDTIGRECYMPGVLAAIRQVIHFDGLVVGLDKVLGL